MDKRLQKGRKRVDEFRSLIKDSHNHPSNDQMGMIRTRVNQTNQLDDMVITAERIGGYHSGEDDLDINNTLRNKKTKVVVKNGQRNRIRNTHVS